MNTHIIKHQNISGIENAGKIAGSIPATGTHTALYLRCLDSSDVALTAAEIIADVGDIAIRVGGQTIIDADAQFLLDMQQYYGAYMDAMNVDGIIPAFYTRPYLPTPQEQVRTALGMIGEGSYTVELDLAATLTKLAKIEVFADKLPMEKHMGEHIVVRKIPQSHSVAAGLDQITDLPDLKKKAKAYLALHAYCSTASVDFDHVTVQANSKDIYKSVPALLNQVRLNKAGRTPQTNYYHMDFALQNTIQSRLRLGAITEFSQDIQFSGAGVPGNYTIFAEQLVDIDDNGSGFQQVVN